MGSWGETCMISKLPIQYKDRVKIIIFYNKSVFYNKDYTKTNLLNRSGFISTSGLIPAFFQIDGVYEDSGIPLIEENFNTEIIFNFIKEKFKSKIKANNEEIEDWDLSDILLGIERGDGKYSCENTNQWYPFDLSFTMIREDIWNSTVEFMKTQPISDWRIGGSNMENWCKRTFKEEIDTIEKIKITTDMNKKWGLTMNDFRLFQGNNTNFWCRIPYENYLSNNIHKNDNIFKLWSEFEYINTFIEEGRIGWTITSSKGSQDGKYEFNKFLAEKIIEICDKNIENYE